MNFLKALAEQMLYSFCYIAAIPALFIVITKWDGLVYTVTNVFN